MYELAKSLNISPPGRPIISGVGTLIEYISGYIDKIRTPLLPNIPSYIKDTTHFPNTIGQIDNLSQEMILVTLDVSALYTNIPHDEGVETYRTFLLHNFPNDKIEDICKLIKRKPWALKWPLAMPTFLCIC